MFRFLASSYSWSLVGPSGPLWERCPPRWDADFGSRVEFLLALFDSPSIHRVNSDHVLGRVLGVCSGCGQR
jgi:hypothetical protein